MPTGRESVKKKIILAAINCIERGGMDSVTTRNVAKKAGVNIAAINYYFGTKEDLLRETFKLTLNHFSRDLGVILEHKSLSIYSRLKVFLIFILRGSIKYPNFMKILLISNKEIYIKEFIEKLKSFLIKAEKLIGNKSNNKENIETEATVMQIFYAALTPGLMISISKNLFGIDLSREEQQLFYINYLLHHYLPGIRNEEIEKETAAVNHLIKQIFNSPNRAWDDQ